jgi:pilus assembly protein TadC
MLTELLAFLDELLSYLESVRDIRDEDGRRARRSMEIERLTQKTRALRDAVSAERQKH